MDTERATLPALVAPLIGREDEMAALRRLLGRRASTGGRRLVTLTGPGGTGKSTLALALGFCDVGVGSADRVGSP
jgi:predicted ATPase